MPIQKIIFGLVSFFHNFFTVIWIGGLALIVLTLLPSIKKVLGTTPQARSLMVAVTQRQRIWVFISVLGLFITGLLMSKGNPNSTGFMHFDTTYAILASVKHILTFIMVLIAGARSGRYGKEETKPSPKDRMGAPMIVVNLILGIAVLVLSSFMAVI